MSKKRNPWDVIGDAVGGAGHAASHAGGGGGGGGNSGGGAIGAASGGAASVSGGVGHATGTSTGYSSAAAGVSSVSSGVGTATGTRPTAPTPTYSSPAYSSTTTVNLRPLMSTITDPATRALAPAAISAGVKYEVNPSLLIASAAITDYGRSGQGKGYTNLGDGSETGAKSIRQAARYLAEAGFHTNPQKAIRSLAKATGADAEQLRKTAAGYTALDDAARKIEHAPGDTNVTGVGRIKFRKPGDRPGVRAAINAATKAGQAATKAVQGQAAAERANEPVGATVNTAPLTPGAGERTGKIANADYPVASKRGAARMEKEQNAEAMAKAQATASAARGSAAVAAALTGEKLNAGPHPRRVAKKLTRAYKKATPEITGLSDPNQAAFAAELSKQTGLSPRVVAAWVRQEGGNLNPGDNNWLNIGAFDSGFDQGIMGDPRFRDPKSAAKVTADFLRGKVYGASEGIQQILNAAGASDQAQIQAIANSGWASDPNYASNIAANYQDVSADVGKEVPKQLIERGFKVLGKDATKAILKGGKVVKDPKAGKGTGPVKVDSAKAEIRAGAIEKASKKEDKYFSYDHSTDRAWFDPILKQQLVKLAKASGEPITLNSGFRTLSEQKAAYADYQSGGALAATPGSSNHEYGLAADISLTDTQRSMLSKFGLGLPVGGEDWHVEVTDPALKAKQTAVNLGTEGSATVTGGDTNIPIKGTNLAVKPPAPASSTGAAPSSGTAPATSPATTLSQAIDAATKAQAGPPQLPNSSAAAYARGGLSGITSAAAAYARASLSQDKTGDPIYDAFRPKR